MRVLSRAWVALLAVFVLPASAQSTDGLHAMQVIPVVVDSSSFTQRFTFDNPSDHVLDIVPDYYPGVGTTGSHVTCPTISLTQFGSRTFASLRDLCPGLASGSQFGFMVLRHLGYHPWAVFSRVSNPQGAGFSVEGFPASTFTSAISVVGGVRRLAATGNSPAYQTNCFVANLPSFSPSAMPATAKLTLSLHNGTGPTPLGTHDIEVPPGRLVRILDIFSTAGPGDFDNVNVTFFPSEGLKQGLASFCTVQDNTSFGADFRIAKMALAWSDDFSFGEGTSSQDQHAWRDVTMEEDDLGRAFSIPPGAFNNVHVLSVRLPDHGRCQLLDGNHQPATPAYGLELRIMDRAGQTLFGGNNAVSAPDGVSPGDDYFGDKARGITNATWFLQVESNGQNTASERPYALRCRTGSGIGRLNLLRYQAAGTEF